MNPEAGRRAFDGRDSIPHRRTMEDNLQPYRQAAQQRFPRPYTPPAEPMHNGSDHHRKNAGENYKTPSPGWQTSRYGESREPYETLNAYYSQPPPRGYHQASPPAQAQLHSSYPHHREDGYERNKMSVSASLTYPEQFPERQQWMRDFQRLNPSMSRGPAPLPFESKTNYSPLRRSRNSRGLLPEVDDHDDDGSNLKVLYPPVTRPIEPFGAATSRSVSRERERRKYRDVSPSRERDDGRILNRDVSPSRERDDGRILHRDVSPSRERDDGRILNRDASPSRERDDGRILHRDVSPSRAEVFDRIYESPRRGHRSSLYDSHRSENGHTMDKKDMTQLREQVEQLQDQLRTAKSMLKEVLNTAPDNTSRQASLDLHSQDDNIRDSSIESSSPIPAYENSDDHDDPTLDSETEELPENISKKRMDAGMKGGGARRKERQVREPVGKEGTEDGEKIKKLEDEIAHLLEENERLQIENEDVEERMHLMEQNSMADALLNMKETYAEEVGRRHNLLKQYQEMEKQRLRHMLYLLQGAVQEVTDIQTTEAGWKLHVQVVDGVRMSFWSNSLPSSPATTWQMRSIPTSQMPLTPRKPTTPLGPGSDVAAAQRQRTAPPSTAPAITPSPTPVNTLTAVPASTLSPLTISFDASGQRSIRSPWGGGGGGGVMGGGRSPWGGGGGGGVMGGGGAEPGPSSLNRNSRMAPSLDSGSAAGLGSAPDRPFPAQTVMSPQVAAPRYSQTPSGTI